jgi:hypothetical protein
MEWNACDVALLTALWTKGHSAGQIADRLVLIPLDVAHHYHSGMISPTVPI